MNSYVIYWQYGAYKGVARFEVGDSTPEESDRDWFEHQSFWLFEGNFCCDCNRSLMDDHIFSRGGTQC